nr:DUF4917 family protein [Proteus mirabilis]
MFSNAKLPENVKSIFDSFNSQDFEYILRKFTQATVINNIFDIDCNDIHQAHSQVKKTLINTVKGIHPCIDKVRDKINNCASFIKQFDTIFSLNYDIMLYWAIMQVNDNHPYPLLKIVLIAVVFMKILKNTENIKVIVPVLFFILMAILFLQRMKMMRS